MPRIISGKAKGLKLKSLKGDKTRPSSDRLKEALFSILQTQLADCDFLDVFAGSGQIGLEALSRGAASATFIEKDRQAQKILVENIQLAGLEKTRVLRGDAARHISNLARRGEQFDFIYLDPPWSQAETLLRQISPLLAAILKAHGTIILELDQDTKGLELIFTYPLVRTCHYGRAMLLFYNE